VLIKASKFHLDEVFLILVAGGKGWQPHRGDSLAWLVICSAIDIFMPMAWWLF